MVIYIYNQGAIKLAQNLVFQKLNKYIAIEYHSIWDFIKQQNISLEYWSTKKMIANGFTKPLDSITFKEFVISLGLIIVIELLSNICQK